MKLTVAGVFALLLTLAATPAQASNIVLNPGFEIGGNDQDGIVPDWSVWFLGWPGLPGLAHTGFASGSTSAPEEFLPVTYIAQVLNTAATETYDLSFWVAETALATTELLIRWNGNTVANFVDPTTSVCSFDSVSSVYNWRIRTLLVVPNLTASSNATLLQVFARQDQGLVLVDDFVVDNAAAVSPVLEPASMMLLGSGLAALAARYRKSRA